MPHLRHMQYRRVILHLHLVAYQERILRSLHLSPRASPRQKKGGGGFEREGEKKEAESKDVAEWGS